MWELDYKESWAWKNWCFWTVVLEKTLESPLDCKEIQPVRSKGDQLWVFLVRMMLKVKLQYFGHLMRELTHWKRLWCWEGMGARGKGYDRGWDVWMALPTQWMWVWVNSRRWWWTGRSGVLRFMGSQRVRHYWAIELNWMNVGNLISGSSAFSKSSLNIWQFTVHVLLKSGLENCEHYFASMCDECNYAVVWTISGITFLWDWNEN